jgi:hypothetical protein
MNIREAPEEGASNTELRHHPKFPVRLTFNPPARYMKQ